MDYDYKRYNLTNKKIKSYPLQPSKDQIPDYYGSEIDARKPYKELEANLPVKLLSHQHEDFNRMVYILLNYDNNSALDTSDAGLGKTYIGCSVILYLNLDAIIVCLKTMKGKWRYVADKFGILDKIKLLVTYQSIRSVKNKTSEPKMLKHGYLLRTDITLDDKKKTQVTTFAPTEKTLKSIEEGTLFIFDEIQNIKDPKSDQFNACYELIRRIPPKSKSKVLLLSRTPIDKFLFAESLLKMLGLLKGEMFYYVSAFGGGSTYKTTEWDDMIKIARSRDDKITSQIFRNVYLRAAVDYRKAAWFLYRDIFRCYLTGEMPKIENNVTTDVANGFYKFPPDIEKKITVELAEIANCLHFQKDLKDKNTIDTSGLKAAMPHMNNVQRLKKDKFLELALKDLKEDPECKVVLFISFKDVMQTLERGLVNEGYKVLMLTGETHENNRQPLIETFNEESNEYRILITNTTVGGVGIDLDDIFGYKQRVFYFMLEFSANNLIQGIKRGKRSNTKQLTNKPALRARFVYMNTEYGTYEMRIYQLLFQKLNIISQSLSEEDMSLLPIRVVKYDINNKVEKEMDSLPENALPPLDPMKLRKMMDEVNEERREAARKEVKDLFDFKNMKKELKRSDSSDSEDEQSDSNSESENLNDLD